MDIAFEKLERLDEIVEKLNVIEQKIKSDKRWLNTKEASYYLGYSQDHIHKLKDSHFYEGKHYFKKAGRILFDKQELDNWVKSSFTEIKPEVIVDNILKDLT